jgi:acetyl-CoA carboxylase biotin carboxyl carrier protein
MTAFENLQELIDLLHNAPGVTELSVGGNGGEVITIKRRPACIEALPAEHADQFEIDARDANPQVDDARSEVDASSPDKPAKDPVHSISANRVGVFHSVRPAIEIGDPVVSDQVVGFIESMKLMNEIRADQAGRIEKQLIEDGMPVEYGQTLFHIAA